MTDEDRLRDRMHDRAARVPDLSDIDDVAARLGRRRPVRERRLLALVALALVAGVGIGVVIGRDDDGGRTVAVGSDGGTTESTGAPTIPTTAVTNTTLVPCSAYLQKSNVHRECIVPSEPLPTLPVPGEQPADPVAARAEVARVWIDASDGASSNETRAAAIEGGASLMAVFDELLNGPYGPQVRSARTVIDDIVFVSPTRAAVKFHADLSNGSTSGPYFVEAALDGNAWFATRSSYCRIVTLAGVHCPE